MTLMDTLNRVIRVNTYKSNAQERRCRINFTLVRHYSYWKTDVQTRVLMTTMSIYDADFTITFMTIKYESRNYHKRLDKS